MISRRALLGASALMACTSPSFGNQTYSAGKEYLVLQPPVQSDANKIEVIAFFAYTCPHCLQFEPVLDEWAKNLPADVVFTSLPSGLAAQVFPIHGNVFRS